MHQLTPAILFIHQMTPWPDTISRPDDSQHPTSHLLISLEGFSFHAAHGRSVAQLRLGVVLASGGRQRIHTRLVSSSSRFCYRRRKLICIIYIKWPALISKIIWYKVKTYKILQTRNPQLTRCYFVYLCWICYIDCFNVYITSSEVKKATSYIAQYPVLRTVQSSLHFTSLTDLFTQTPSRLLLEASSHMLQLMREGCSHTYPPLSIARYSFIQLSELEQCRVKKLAQGFNATAQDSNPGSRSRESEILPLSHCVLHISH